MQNANALVEIFLEQAVLRRRKAAECPDDATHSHAANCFDQLADTVCDVEPSAMQVFCKRYEDLPDAPLFQKLLREIGPLWSPDASAFVTRFIEHATKILKLRAGRDAIGTGRFQIGAVNEVGKIDTQSQADYAARIDQQIRALGG